ncbi:Acid proteinase [Colletotrichum higginsianum IMI 349063]|uniref:Acid proteinase n=3 Tax=Colletotrichum higginsianum TaxID=80884 RepID=A0A1B7YEV9_COLHI|nr:Acid proteinase [Colletotrichum higginsianum IMI 349063]OBR10434.1 Acid proteinase [Colletotrichum higginsianum IMI 349063]
MLVAMKLSATLLLLGAGLSAVAALDVSVAKEAHRLAIERREASRDEAHTLQSRTNNRSRSRNWSGGAVTNDRYQSVTAEVIIPNITFPDGYDPKTTYSSSVWVGISGYDDFCDVAGQTGLIQGGYYYLYDKEGDFGVFAFYEWFPDGPVFLDDTEKILTNIGDHVRMTVTQKNNNTGTYTWENLTQGKKFEKSLTAPTNGSLCTNTAEWVVESFMSEKDHTSLYPDFGELKFTNIKAVAESGKPASLSDAYFYDAEPLLNGKRLTNCAIQPETASTTCKWLGYKGIFSS